MYYGLDCLKIKLVYTSVLHMSRIVNPFREARSTLFDFVLPIGSGLQEYRIRALLFEIISDGDTRMRTDA